MRDRDRRLADKVRQARLDKNIGMRDFVEKIGLAPCNIPLYSRFEGGIEAPTEEMLAKVCEFLGFDLKEMQELNAKIEYIPFDWEKDINLNSTLICRKQKLK